MLSSFAEKVTIMQSCIVRTLVLFTTFVFSCTLLADSIDDIVHDPLMQTALISLNHKAAANGELPTEQFSRLMLDDLLAHSHQLKPLSRE